MNQSDSSLDGWLEFKCHVQKTCKNRHWKNVRPVDWGLVVSSPTSQTLWPTLSPGVCANIYKVCFGIFIELTSCCRGSAGIYCGCCVALDWVIAHVFLPWHFHCSIDSWLYCHASPIASFVQQNEPIYFFLFSYYGEHRQAIKCQADPVVLGWIKGART